ncbi:unnamed protein product [Meloidogyne enterolobii]|uniref:Uncharacterized protein n=1 Tax=Meloidogyne enterolobii TaxID=390850 RepID=A0ACB1AYV6_MELEN
MAFCSFLLIKFFSFSLTSKYAIFKVTLFCGSFFMLLYVLLLSLYFFALYGVLKSLRPSLTSSKCFSTLSKIIPNIFVFVIALLIFMLICSSFYVNITTFTIENIFSIGVRIVMAFFSLFCFFCSLATYFYFLNKFVAKFPLTMDSIEKIFFS